MNTINTNWLARGLAGLRELGPYAAIELLVPGGSIVAVLLWLYRRHRRMSGADLEKRAAARAARAAPLAGAALLTTLAAGCASTHGLAPHASVAKGDDLAVT